MADQTLSPRLQKLHVMIASGLSTLGEGTPYIADANEPDPRYLGYGVRAPEMRTFLARLRPELSPLNTHQKLSLAQHLVASGYGEQKSVALALLEQIPDYFSPERFDVLEDLFRSLHGWSKIDGYTKLFLPKILERHPDDLLPLLGRWNTDADRWLRRTSVVLFTRKVAQSRMYKDTALKHCTALIHDPEHLVQTGVGWCLRDLMRWDKPEILSYVKDLRKARVSSKITLYALRDIKGDERKSILS